MTKSSSDALVVAPRLTANAGLLEPLGLKPAEVRMGSHVLGTQVEADRAGATGVPGVWAAGNVTDIQAQVITDAAAGLAAGTAINADLAAKDARRAERPVKVFGPPTCWVGVRRGMVTSPAEACPLVTAGRDVISACSSFPGHTSALRAER